MATTVYDIARAAGVNDATVCRALRDDKRISKETKERIKRIAEELNYRPNLTARSLAVGKSGLIGVIVTPAVLPTFKEIIEPLEKRVLEAGYSIVFYTTTGHPQGERASVELLLRHKVDGVIAIPGSNTDNHEAYKELVDAGIKLVLIDRRIEGLDVPQILGDDYQAAKIAADYLISLGHRDIVYYAIPRKTYAGRERIRGFVDAMTEAGISVDPDSIIDTDLGEEAGVKAAQKLLQRKKLPTAIMARQDIVAVGMMHAIISAGLTIPGDISLIGNGDIWCGNILQVPLTTVHHPLKRISVMGVKKLIDMLNGKEVAPETTLLSNHLVVRSSCAPPKMK